MLVAQAELLASGMITLSWMGKTPCQTAVGIGKMDSMPDAIAFSQLSRELGPVAPDCTEFSGKSWLGLRLKHAAGWNLCKA